MTPLHKVGDIVTFADCPDRMECQIEEIFEEGFVDMSKCNVNDEVHFCDLVRNNGLCPRGFR
jgi:hypothetical protein